MARSEGRCRSRISRRRVNERGKSTESNSIRSPDLPPLVGGSGSRREPLTRPARQTSSALAEQQQDTPGKLNLELAADLKVPVRPFTPPYGYLGRWRRHRGVARAQPQDGAHRNILFDRQAQAAAGAVQDVRLLWRVHVPAGHKDGGLFAVAAHNVAPIVGRDGQ